MTDSPAADPLAGWVVVGRLGKPHGTRGELTVEVRTDDPEGRYADGARLHRAGGGPVTVAGHRWHNGRLLLSLAGVSDRNAAEALRDTLLLIDPALDPPLADEDTFYDHQLTGLRVELADGTPIGEVIDVLHPPGADLLAVRRDRADRADRADGDPDEVLLPFVRAVVPTVDLAGRRLVITPPDGLL